MLSHFAEVYKTRLIEPIEVLKAALVSGSVSSMESYKHLTGQLTGLYRAKELFDEVLRTYLQTETIEEGQNEGKFY